MGLFSFLFNRRKKKEALMKRMSELSKRTITEYIDEHNSLVQGNANLADAMRRNPITKEEAYHRRQVKNLPRLGPQLDHEIPSAPFESTPWYFSDNPTSGPDSSDNHSDSFGGGDFGGGGSSGSWDSGSSDSGSSYDSGSSFDSGSSSSD